MITSEFEGPLIIKICWRGMVISSTVTRRVGLEHQLQDGLVQVTS
jgi:hypothetical protein